MMMKIREIQIVIQINKVYVIMKPLGQLIQQNYCFKKKELKIVEEKVDKVEIVGRKDEKS